MNYQQINLFSQLPILTVEEEKNIKSLCLDYPEIAFNLFTQKGVPVAVALFEVLSKQIDNPDSNKLTNSYASGESAYYLDKFKFMGATISVFDDFDNFWFFALGLFKDKEKPLEFHLYEWQDQTFDLKRILPVVKNNLLNGLLQVTNLIKLEL